MRARPTRETLAPPMRSTPSTSVPLPAGFSVAKAPCQQTCRSDRRGQRSTGGSPVMGSCSKSSGAAVCDPMRSCQDPFITVNCATLGAHLDIVFRTGEPPMLLGSFRRTPSSFTVVGRGARLGALDDSGFTSTSYQSLDSNGSNRHVAIGTGF
jgi:hypothetical protein